MLCNYPNGFSCPHDRLANPHLDRARWHGGKGMDLVRMNAQLGVQIGVAKDGFGLGNRLMVHELKVEPACQQDKRRLHLVHGQRLAQARTHTPFEGAVAVARHRLVGVEEAFGLEELGVFEDICAVVQGVADDCEHLFLLQRILGSFIVDACSVNISARIMYKRIKRLKSWNDW